MPMRSLFLVASLLCATLAHAADDAAPTWQAGTAWQTIDPPQPTSTGSKVEVLEVFSYACPHCAHFQPYADKLKASLPKNAEFVLMPADFQPRWVAFARGFYVAKDLGLVDGTHQALFDAIYRDHRPLNSLDDIAGFYAEHGADKESFVSTMQSFVIDGRIAKIREMEAKYGVDQTPTLIVNGKYRIVADPDKGIGFDQMVDIALYLVKQESAPKKH
ncbi:thiol:disulfide interchange protein DsbA/DsbL [Dokdonella sp.]|jgi:thiol:disulfide interchange protein DsbA|uniref:thiol:disulfide interchange protein DsbA/DsbL n=1 Tax=Dokdonella sp. TaxID=2291710 RepID=UPI002F41161B